MLWRWPVEDFDSILIVARKKNTKLLDSWTGASVVMNLRPLGLPYDVSTLNEFWSRRARRLKYAALRCGTGKRAFTDAAIMSELKPSLAINGQLPPTTNVRYALIDFGAMFVAARRGSKTVA